METESTLSSYHIFNAVAETGNISKAAKTLYISQPAISRAVSRLEQALSVKLFIRGSRGVRLTEEGKLLYEHTRSAFDSLKQGEENLRRVGTLGIGHLRIGVSTTLCKYILMPYLQCFIQQNPHIRITIQCQSTFDTLSLLEDGKIDVGLIGEPAVVRFLDFYPIRKIEDVFVATEEYLTHLEQRCLDETISDRFSVFKNGNLMLLDEKNITRRYIEDYFSKNGIQTGQLLEVSNMDLLIDFAKIGLGISCVIKEFVQEELEQGTLLEVPLPKKIEKRNVGFAYNRSTAASDAVTKFIRFYKGEAHECNSTKKGKNG